jgi:hypothetical protein
MTKAQHKVFRSHFDSWDKMAEQVTEFLSGLGRDRVIGISRSQESQFGVIIVWYWG